ncbi:hypothetical protein QYE76_032044 [Lolium multiflorum]|uniref:CCHC-type domain-containing protein n=1 Tax=Lolium multiflorum TaxID=4521 RepID=A0AAD8QSY1_LOLMU|nr:hypothetical protein QYE76_032044 [Lolium multiflorum]
MGSHVVLSDSELSGESVSSRAPPPPLRSVVVAPAGRQLGLRGWDAGAGPSHAPAAPPVRPVEAAPAQNPWQVSESRRARNARRAQERAGRARQVFPASRPPGDNPRRIPAVLHGRCYNCGQEGHVSAMCTNDTLCVRCGGTEHTSRSCKRPRSSPETSPPLQPPPLPLRVASRGAGAGDPQVRPAAAHAADVVRTWRDVVSSGDEGAAGGGSGTADFSAPFGPVSPSPAPPAGRPRVNPSERVDLCYLLPSQGMVQLEADLDRAVMVSVAGNRPAVTMEVAAEEIRAQLHLPVDAFSIRPFEPADFLVLCESLEVRDQLVHAEFVSSPVCTLYLEPWSRQTGALLRETPFLADVEIRGIPGHAWAERTADKLLEGSGVIDAIDPATASRRDMSCFRLSLWTHDIASIPAVRWLAVPEPGSGLRLQVSDGRRRPRSESPKMLWYRIRFWVVRWLIGGPSSFGDSDAGDRPGGDGANASGADGSESRDGGAARPRRRRRRAHRRRRGRRAGGDAANAGAGADAAADGQLVDCAVDAAARLDRWEAVPMGSEIPGAVLPRAHVSPAAPAGVPGVAAFASPGVSGRHLRMRARALTAPAL